jgi:hypothetical protein
VAECLEILLSLGSSLRCGYERGGLDQQVNLITPLSDARQCMNVASRCIAFPSVCGSAGQDLQLCGEYMKR